MTTPTKKKQPCQRSMELLRRQGYVVGVVEHWNPHARIRQDLFGFLDLVCLGGPMLSGTMSGIWGIQVTSLPNLSTRRKKAMAEPNLKHWLEAGGRFFLHGWKLNALGKWEVKEEEITLEDLHL